VIGLQHDLPRVTGVTDDHRSIMTDRQLYDRGVASVDESLTWLRVPSAGEVPAEVRELWAPSLEKLGFVPNVLRLYALRPDNLLAWNAWYEVAMKGDSGLTKAEREMIAVVVSLENDCPYCIAAHSAALRKIAKDPGISDRLAAGYREAGLEPRQVAMLDYAVKLTRRPAAIIEADVEALRGAGWSDEDVMDIAEVTGLFNMSNRMASGLGWAPNPEYEALGR
jgi:uncharacterized peroxidase-related enzyme